MTILAADFWPKTARRPATLSLTTITNGRREFIEERPVADKREARKLAVALGYTPWNF
jgi:hypothetical protein